MSASETSKESKKKGPGFQMILTLFLSMTLVTAGILWEVYGYLPPQYYIPISLGVVVLYGALAYVFLSRTINIS
ncbi:MAG: hypothetical protein ACYC9U_12845 [Nitrososphaerales archaeon]